ncbi:DUF4145 domain-containing protein [Deinococcus phoenicis]|uniref:DUF4145 domain-containing protein n=1 Tax=Deinococcus phoenicis TaxID=1476583 RepID=UPI0009E067A5|nr:DUF4145 domain-containing protein [Deinococcus phoenicis]
MEYAENYRKNLLMAKEGILKSFERRLSLIDFILAKKVINKIVEEELKDFDDFEEEIKSGNHLFVSDLITEDKLAFSIRGTLHIERVLDKIIVFTKLKPKDKRLVSKIDALASSDISLARLGDVLHKIRDFRNNPAHELDAGREVTKKEAQEMYLSLDKEAQERIVKELEPSPLSLKPDQIVKLCMVVVLTELEVGLMTMKWTAQLADVLLPPGANRPF